MNKDRLHSYSGTTVPAWFRPKQTAVYMPLGTISSQLVIMRSDTGDS